MKISLESILELSVPCGDILVGLLLLFILIISI